MVSPRTYFAFGLCIRSERPIPELTESADGAGQRVDIRWASLSAELPGAHYRNSVLQVAGDEIQILVRNVVRFRLHAGASITVDPFPDVSDRDVRAYLLGTALGLMCHQRDLLPLHANAIAIGDRAVAIAGNSGAGKSTLAAHFHGEGYGLLSDDVCAVSFPEAGHPLAWSGIPRVRLWKDAAQTFGRDIHGLEPVVGGLEKYNWPTAVRAPRHGLPLGGIYILSEAETCPSDEISQLSGSQAATAVMEQTFRRELIGFIGGAERRFARTMALLARVPVFRVPWRRDFSLLAANAAKLEAHFHDQEAIAGRAL